MRAYTITLNETQAGTIQIACEVLAAPATQPAGWTNADADAARLALELHRARLR